MPLPPLFNRAGAGRPAFAPISASASGDNTIVTGVAGKSIIVTAYAVVCTGAVTGKWRSGLVADGAGQDLSGAMPFSANGGLVVPECHRGWFATDLGKDLVLVLGSGVVVAGHIQYIQQ